MNKQDPRKASFTTSSGTNVRNTSQLKGEARKSRVESETNTIQQYIPSKSGCSGPMGGEAKH